MTVVHLPPRLLPAVLPQDRFYGGRQAMLRGLLAWMQTGATRDQIAQEVAGTVAAVEQLRDLQLMLKGEKQ